MAANRNPRYKDFEEVLGLRSDEPMLRDDLARAMWEAVRAHANPTLPIPLPFDELAEGEREQLRIMADAALSALGLVVE